MATVSQRVLTLRLLITESTTEGAVATRPWLVDAKTIIIWFCPTVVYCVLALCGVAGIGCWACGGSLFVDQQRSLVRTGRCATCSDIGIAQVTPLSTVILSKDSIFHVGTGVTLVLIAVGQVVLAFHLGVVGVPAKATVARAVEFGPGFVDTTTALGAVKAAIVDSVQTVH